MAKKATMSAGEAGLARSIEARPGAVSRVNAEHYRWGHDCDAWHLVKDPQFTVIEELIPPGAAEVRHYHKKAQQFFYILSGQAVIEVEGEDIVLGQGEGLHIPPGVPHRFRNASAEAVEFLVISQPPSHGDRIIA